MRTKDAGICDKCGTRFEYYLLHNGFNESAFAYCDKCGRTAILHYYSKKVPTGIEFGCGQEIKSSQEPFLEPCECGGRYKGAAAPRCPHCGNELSAEAAAQYLEANAPGTKNGWLWQRSWRGLYCIVINDRRAEDNWKTAAKKE